jgi:N-acetylmuramoyl-L-alanine amidase
MWTIAVLACVCLASRSALAGFPQCPNIGYSAGCAILIDIQPDGSLKIRTDPTVPPYDNIEDTLVGVVNHSGATVFGISLTGPDIFGFDGDGAGDPTGSFWAAGSPFGAFPGGPFGPFQYEGPDTSFSPIDANGGIVNFPKGLDNNNSLWFSLEGSPSQIKLASTVTIDPGHGSDCASVGQPVGAIGTTDFPPSPPPPGKLHEDDLAVAISLSLKDILVSASYTVTMTKTSPVSCPTFLERGTIANKARSNFFVSVHLNAPRFCPLGLFCGTEVLYNSSKTDSAKLAQLMAGQIAANLGVNNRGAIVRNDLAVLKATVSRMTAVIAEVARLSPSDDAILHDPASLPKAAKGIFLGIDDFVNQ